MTKELEKKGEPDWAIMTEEETADVCGFLSDGMTVFHACASAGVAIETYNMTMAKARQGNTDAVMRALDVRKAIGDSLAALYRSMQIAGGSDWKMWKALIEMKFPDMQGELLGEEQIKEEKSATGMTQVTFILPHNGRDEKQIKKIEDIIDVGKSTD